MATAPTDFKKNIDKRCLLCFNKTYQRLFDTYKSSTCERLQFMVFFQEILHTQKNLTPPEIQGLLNRRFCEISGLNDPFAAEKAESNKTALRLHDVWALRVRESADPFDTALRLAIAGNIMDYGANNTFDVHQTIERVMHTPFATDSSVLLREQIKKAKTILYLGDNVGEIIFDRLFIQTCMFDKNVFFAVRGAPVLNDVTVADALKTGIQQVARVISNGDDAPSTILEHCTHEFKSVFKTADLIISKGQGNFEGLADLNDPRIFFLFMVKCELIAEVCGVPEGSFMVYNKRGK